jgi:signal transduction histidine kinase
MELINLAAVALFKALDKHNIDRSLLIEGTGLKIDYLNEHHKKHRWDQFVRMYDNCAALIGPDETAKEIGYQGIYNEKIALIRKVGTGLFDVKTGYWYTATFVARHLYKESVVFKYKKNNDKQVTVEINIHPELADCPLLLQTYTHLFEILPTALGLPKARVVARITERRGEYTIYLKHTSYFKLIWKRFLSVFREDTSTVELITDLENQSIELSKVIDQKSQLLRILSHDISNQITIIDYYLKKTMRNEELSEEDHKYLSIAKNSSNKLYNILKNVQNLEITSLRGIDIVPVYIEKIFMSVEYDFQTQLEHKKITLKCRNELNSNVYVLAEASSLETNVLGNLMTNAIKFSPEGSTIELKARLVGEKVLITVSDQGMGIPFEERRSLFTKKIRNSSVGTSGEMGTGFGLGIVSQYVKLFNGRISVESNIPHGSVFVVELDAFGHK